MTKVEVTLSRRKSSPPSRNSAGRSKRFEHLTQGAYKTLTVGDPTLQSADVGPVIDEAVKAALDADAAETQTVDKPLLRVSIGALVGVPPFGGQNPSGTGPKAGGWQRQPDLAPG